MRHLLILAILALLVPTASRGDDAKPGNGGAAPAARAPAAAAEKPGPKTKSLDFDSEVVEGMNKNPLDSLTRVGKKDDKQQGHLYRRKSHFKREIRQTVQEMGYTQ